MVIPCGFSSSSLATGDPGASNQTCGSTTSFIFGPMSLNVVDSILEYTQETGNPIGLIPSRRQVEWDGGYVNNTTSIVQSDWNHFTLVYDGSLTGNINRAKIYFNGVDETVNEAGTVPAVTNVGGPNFELGTLGGIVTSHSNQTKPHETTPCLLF